MPEEFDLNYSEDGLLTRVIFLASCHDINIFVEDINKEYEYEEIFERLFTSEFRINCIFPTGGKKKLEEAFHLFGSSEEYGKTFFIADGDFDRALGTPMIVANNFVYLNRYNIESYLLHKDSILRFMRPRLQKTLLDTQKLIKYDEWYDASSKFLEKLFVLHFVVQKFCPTIENVGRGYARFFNPDGTPKESEYDKYKLEISKIISDIDDKIAYASNELKAIYGTKSENFICGKCFIGSLKSYLNTFINKKVNESEVKAILISGFDTLQLSYVTDKLFSYLDIDNYS